MLLTMIAGHLPKPAWLAAGAAQVRAGLGRV